MEFIEVSAKTVEDALTEASIKLGVTSDQLQYEVIEKGTSGFLGIGSKPAVIKAKVKEETPETVKEDICEVAKNFLKEVFNAMDMAVVMDVKYDEAEKNMDVDLSGDDMGVLIGKRGKTLDVLPLFFILSGRRCTGAFEDLPIMFNHPAFTTTSSTTVVATISP